MAERPGFVNLLERIRTRRRAPDVLDRVSQAERPHLPPPDYEPPRGAMPTEQAELPFQPRRLGAESADAPVDGDRPSTMAQRLFAWSQRRAAPPPRAPEAPRADRGARVSWQDQWGFGLAGLMLVLIAGAGAIFHWSGPSPRSEVEATRAEPPRVPGTPASAGRDDSPDRTERTEKIGRPDRPAPPAALPEPRRAEREAPPAAAPAPRAEETESDRTAPPAKNPPAAEPQKRERPVAPRLAALSGEFAQHLIREKRITAACVREAGGAAKALSVRPLQLSEAGTGEFAVRRQGACCKEAKRCGVAIYARGEGGLRPLLLARPADELRGGTIFNHGYRDLRHQDRQRAAGPFETVFRFDGQRYQKIACFEARWTGPKPDRGARPHGKWQRVECATVVAGKAKPKKTRETADGVEPPAE